MATKKTNETPKLSKQSTDNTHETVTLTDTYANHGSIVCRSGVIEFTDNTAMVSIELAEELRTHGIVV